MCDSKGHHTLSVSQGGVQKKDRSIRLPGGLWGVFSIRKNKKQREGGKKEKRENPQNIENP